MSDTYLMTNVYHPEKNIYIYTIKKAGKIRYVSKYFIGIWKSAYFYTLEDAKAWLDVELYSCK